MSKQTALLGIMDAEVFKSRTKATNAVGGFSSKFKSRGGGLASIDIALERWFKACDNGNIAARTKLDLIDDIVIACDQWAAEKGRLGKDSALSVARAQVVSEVQRSCPKAQQYLKNKSKSESASPQFAPVRRGGTKSLESGYANERANYVAGNKQQNPYSASNVSETLGEHAMSGMSHGQFSFAAAGMDRVEFLDRKARLAHLVIIQGGLLFQDGKPMSTAVKVGSIWADTYAVDKYGNLYSKPFKATRNLRFNHSSYCAGKEVICAGTICCREGKLVYVSNMSGHYKPSWRSVLAFLRILTEEGVDLSETMVECLDTKTCTKATTLLTGAAPTSDWQLTTGNDNTPALMVAGKLVTVNNPG